MADADNGDIIPKSTEVILFAEDLVQYIMFNSMGVPYVPTRADRYRNMVYNHFTPTVRVAANFFCKQLEKEVNTDFDHFTSENNVTRNAYRTYMRFIQESYPMINFNAKNVFISSVHLTLMAAKFSLAGVRDAPDLAVTGIVEKFESCEMTSDTWNSLHMFSSVYAQIYQDMDNVLTPDSGSDISTIESSLSDVSKNSAPEDDDDDDDSENRSFRLDPSEDIAEDGNKTFSPNDDNTWQCKTFVDIFEKKEQANIQYLSPRCGKNLHTSDSSETQSESYYEPFMEVRYGQVPAVSPSEGTNLLLFQVQPIIPLRGNQFHPFGSYVAGETETFEWPIIEFQQGEVDTIGPFQAEEFLSFVGNATKQSEVCKDEKYV